MSESAVQLLDAVRAELAPAPDANRFVAEVARGGAPLSSVAALAAEESRVVPSDRRSFLFLAARAADTVAGEFFSALAAGESQAAVTLAPLAEAAGMDQAALAAYQVRPQAQAYPAYVAWLALNADPAEVVIATVANFAAWGSYCAALGTALRADYGFGDDACAFFDFFAGGAQELERLAVDAVAQALSAGQPLARAREYGRLLQGYELMFWDMLADLPAPPDSSDGRRRPIGPAS
ncbi:transcriptional regulator [Frankia sp. QA3]|uniref:transcriptional regulator n=1 Tax=Frankia sp. QA3 TaxID=710111 RepID=UPI000269CBA3|nr:transcriptional regulator [Frankia sp. QA3]EIV95468.1 putative transcription activator [Frankia sp. QA3]